MHCHAMHGLLVASHNNLFRLILEWKDKGLQTTCMSNSLTVRNLRDTNDDTR